MEVFNSIHSFSRHDKLYSIFHFLKQKQQFRDYFKVVLNQIPGAIPSENQTFLQIEARLLKLNGEEYQMIIVKDISMAF